MPDNEKDNDACSDASSDFEGATQPNLTDKENIMSTQYDRCAIDRPFQNHRLFTEHKVTNVDIDRILRPILEEHGVGLSDYDPYKLSFKIGEKTIQFSVQQYTEDPDLEDNMRIEGNENNFQRIIIISNRCSIKGTEILIDFLKAFQKEYPQLIFEKAKGVYREDEVIKNFYIDGESMHDPDLEWVLEIEDPEAYLAEMENGKTKETARII